MTHEDASKILQDINNGRFLIHEDVSFIQDVFNAIVLFDSTQIQQLAKEFLQADYLSTLKNNSIDKDEFNHRVTMDTFYESMLSFLEEKFPKVEPSVEHDIASWIEANIETITSGNLQQMEAFISKNPSYKDILKFHQKIDFDVLESEQNRILQETWEKIELEINQVLTEFETQK